MVADGSIELDVEVEDEDVDVEVEDEDVDVEVEDAIDIEDVERCRRRH